MAPWVLRVGHVGVERGFWTFWVGKVKVSLESKLEEKGSVRVLIEEALGGEDGSARG